MFFTKNPLSLLFSYTPLQREPIIITIAKPIVSHPNALYARALASLYNSLSIS